MAKKNESEKCHICGAEVDKEKDYSELEYELEIVRLARRLPSDLYNKVKGLREIEQRLKDSKKRIWTCVSCFKKETKCHICGDCSIFTELLLCDFTFFIGFRALN